MSPCVHRLHQEQRLVAEDDVPVDVPFGDSRDAVVAELVGNLTERLDVDDSVVDLVLTDSFNLARASNQRALGFRNGTSVVGLLDNLDAHPLAKLAWINVVAALFNREAAGASVVRNVASRYACNRDVVASAVLAARNGTRPKVLWINGYDANFNCLLYTSPSPRDRG